MINSSNKISKETDLSKEELIKRLKSLEKQIEDLQKKERRLSRYLKTYTQLIDLSPQLIFAHDKNGDLTFGNRSFKTAFGIDNNNISTFNIKHFLADPIQLHEIEKSIPELLKSRRPKYFPSLKLRYNNGEEKIHSSAIIPVYLSDDTLPSLLYFSSDISDFEHINSLLSEKSVFIDTLFASSPDAILIQDADDLITTCNEEVQNILGYSKNDLLGKKFSSIVAEEDQKKALLNKDILKKNKSLRDFQLELIKSDQSTILAELSSNRVEDEKGNLIGTITILRDITLRKKTEFALKESERRFKNLVNHSPNGLLFADLQGNILEVNPQLLQVFGSPSAEATKAINLLQHKPLEEAGISNDFKRCIETSSIISNKCQYTSKWNKHAFLSYCFVPVTNLKNELTGVLATFNDTTQQTRDQQELLKAYTAIENSGNAITSSTLDDKLTFVNKAAVKLWGYKSPEEMVEMANIQNLFAKNSQETIKEIYKRLLTENTYHSYDEIFVKRRDGRIIPVELRASLLRDDNGIPIGVTSSWNDITQQKIVKRELVKAKQRAEESDRLKSAFLANMSHEIRTPMNGIIGFSNLLKSSKISDPIKEKYIDLINSNGETLVKIIDDIIDIAKIESKQFRLIEKSSNLAEVFTELHSCYLKNLIKYGKGHLTLTLNIPDEKHVILTDGMRLKQIMSNLISNAIKFTYKGTIEFGYRLKDGQNIEFFVTDSGIGLPEDKKEDIFERFMQLDDSPAREYGGTGLGLTISKNLVELMGGEIGVESVLGKGSSFYFTLPYRKAELSYLPPKPEKRKYNLGYEWIDKKILIAEDEEDNYLLLEELLKDTGAVVLRARDGNEAIQIFKNKIIDLVLLDIKMPNINGYEALKEFKTIKKEVPIVVQTAYAMASEKNRIVEAGCDAYLTKPLEINHLLQVIDEFLGKE